MDYTSLKHKLGLRGKIQPGDLLKVYKRKVNNKSKYFGETDTNKKTSFVNKKKSKLHPSHVRPIKKGANKYPEVLDTITHETLHMLHPKMTEKQAYKKTRKLMDTMPKAQKKWMYNLYT